jgi:hypothetical protein
MNGFLFSGPNATRPAALSAVLAGQDMATKAASTPLGRMVADRLAADQARRLKAKPGGGGDLAEALAGAPRLIDDVEAIIAKFRSGGVS